MNKQQSNPVSGFRPLMICLLSAVVAQCAAQEVEPAKDGAGRLAGIQVIQKNPETGEVFPVPGISDEMLREILDRAQTQANPPLYRIDELEVTGSVLQGLVDLQVEFNVQILRDQERVAVHVGFDELQLKSHAHHSDVINGTAYPNEARLPVKEWLFYGQGLHRLSLTLIGSVRTTPTGTQRIVFGVPKSAVSRLKLKFSEVVDSVLPASGKPMQLTTDAALGTSEFQMWGLVGETDISWQSNPSVANQPPVLQATAAAQMTLDLQTSPASLQIRQPLTVSGGAISELRVRLPEGFRQVAIEVTDANNNSVVKSVDVADDESSEALIRFGSAVSGLLRLDYDLGLKDTTYPQEISIRIPDVDHVTNETGDLEILFPRGLDFGLPREVGVRSKRVETSRDTRTAARAYRLLSSESRIDLKVSESESFFAASPQISFTTEQDQILKRDTILITARFSINVIRGSLNELKVRWPDYLGEGWQILAGDTRLITGETSIPISGFASPDNADGFTVVFPERQSGQFDIELQGFRDLESFQQGDGLVFLPDVDTPTPHSTVVSLVESDAYSMYLTPQNEQLAFPVLPSNRWPANLRKLNQPLTAWLVDVPEQALRIRITPQQPEVRTQMLVSISVANQSFHVREVLTFDVRHRDLSEIRLALAGNTPTVRLENATVPLERTVVEGDVVTYSLPAPMRGQFQLIIDYNWSPPDFRSEQLTPKVSLPLVMPESFVESIENTVVATNVPQTLVLQDVPGVRPVYSEEFSAAWSLPTVLPVLPIQLRQSLRKEQINSPQFAVVTSLVNGVSLVTRTTAVYDKFSSVAFFRVDKDATLLRASINGRPAIIDRVTADDESDALFQLRPPGDAVLNVPVDVTIIVQQAVKSGSINIQSVLPRLVGVSDCNTIWILPQPPGRTVFSLGSDIVSIGAQALPLIGRFNRSHSAAAIEAVLSPFPEPFRKHVAGIIRESTSHSGACELMIGTILGSRRFIFVLPEGLTLLIVATVSLVAYLLILKLGRTSLFSVTVIAVTIVSVGIGLVPASLQTLLIRLSPLCGLAVLAAVVQRIFSGTPGRLYPHSGTADGSTIFAVEPVPLVVPAGRATVPASGNSLPQRLSAT